MLHVLNTPYSLPCVKHYVHKLNSGSVPFTCNRRPATSSSRARARRERPPQPRCVIVVLYVTSEGGSGPFQGGLRGQEGAGKPKEGKVKEMDWKRHAREEGARRAKAVQGEAGHGPHSQGEGAWLGNTGRCAGMQARAVCVALRMDKVALCISRLDST